MSQQVEGATRTFLAGEALEAFRRVKLNTTANEVVYADAGDLGIGVTQAKVADAAPVSVRLNSAPGTSKMMTAGAVSIGDVLYSAADGKVDDAPSGAAVGRAIEVATADGDIIEVIFDPNESSGSGERLEVIAGVGDIAAGDLVYVSDETDGVLTVLPAQATSGGRLADGICPNAITAGAKGVMLTRHVVANIDTSASSAAGAEVYLSDSTAGGYTFTKPTATDKIQIVGRVTEDHATTGAIFFDVSGPQQVVHAHVDASEGGATLGTAGTGAGAITLTSTGVKLGGAADEKVGFFGTTPAAQPSHNADPAACDAITFSHSWNGSTYPSAAEGAALIADLAALKAATDANKAAIDAINANDATLGTTAPA